MPLFSIDIKYILSLSTTDIIISFPLGVYFIALDSKF